MDFIKVWTLSVCVTVTIAVIFSFLAPRGSLGKFYKVIISLFICLSFVYPFNDFNRLDLKGITAPAVENNTDRIISDMICTKIKSTLSDNNIVGADVNCSVSVDADSNIKIKSVQVAVGGDYDLEDVEKIIFDELSIVAEVIYIGQ